MDIDSLKIFCDVLRHKSFTRAADANSLTQSAVSQRLKALEKKFGMPLIERRGSQLRLTKAGEALHRGALRILADARALEEQMREMGGETGGSVRVAAIYSVGLYELNPFVKKFLQYHPDIDVQVEYSRADKIYQEVLGGTIDIGVVAYPPKKAQLRCVPIRNDELTLICACNHVIARQDRVSVRGLDGEPFVAFAKDMPTRRALDEVFSSNGVSPRIKVEFDNIELIKRAVEIGLGVAVVPSMTVKSEIEAGLLKSLPIVEGPYYRPIVALLRRSRSLTPAVKKFLSVLTETRD
jgi:LysR family transcriptional regulator, transcriptional activator of the cysJI operon